MQSEMSEWISSEAGSHADINVLKSEHQKLKSLVNPIEFRKSEATKRPEMVKMLQDNLEQAKNVAAMIKAAMEKAAEEAKEAAASEQNDTSSGESNEDTSNLPDDADKNNKNDNDQNSPTAPSSSSSLSSVYSDKDLSSVTSTYNEITAWLTEKQAAQDQLLDNADPVLLSADIEAKARKLNDVAMAMLQRQMRAQQKQQRQQKSKQQKKSSGKGDEKGSEEGEKKQEETKEEKVEMPREDEKGEEKGDDTTIHVEL